MATQGSLDIDPCLLLADPHAFGVDIGVQIEGRVLVRDVVQVDAHDIRRHFRTGSGNHDVVVLDPLHQLLKRLLTFRRLRRELLPFGMQLVELLDVGGGLATLFALGGEVLPGRGRPGALVVRPVVLRDAGGPGGAVIPMDRCHHLVRVPALIEELTSDILNVDVDADLFDLLLKQLKDRSEVRLRILIGDPEDKVLAVGSGAVVAVAFHPELVQQLVRRVEIVGASVHDRLTEQVEVDGFVDILGVDRRDEGFAEAVFWIGDEFLPGAAGVVVLEILVQEQLERPVE